MLCLLFFPDVIAGEPSVLRGVAEIAVDEAGQAAPRLSVPHQTAVLEPHRNQRTMRGAVVLRPVPQDEIQRAIGVVPGVARDAAPFYGRDLLIAPQKLLKKG